MRVAPRRHAGRGFRREETASCPLPLSRSLRGAIPGRCTKQPDRMLDGYVMICSCVTCRAVLVERGRREPRSLMAIKTASDRLLVTSDLLGEVLEAEAPLDTLVYVDGDYVRSLYVPVAAALPPRQRWWSARCAEDDRAAGLAARRYRVPRRQSRARRDARAASHAITDSRPAPPPDLVVIAECGPLCSDEAPTPDRRGGGVGTRTGPAAATRRARADPRRNRDATVARSRRGGGAAPASTPCCRSTSSTGVRCIARSFPTACPKPCGRISISCSRPAGSIPPAIPCREVRKPLRCYGGLDEQGRPQRDARAPRVPCECHVVYRGPKAGTVERAGS